MANHVDDLEGFSSKIVFVNKAVETLDFGALSKFLQRSWDGWSVRITGTGFFTFSFSQNNLLNKRLKIAISAVWVKLELQGGPGFSIFRVDAGQSVTSAIYALK